MFIPSAAGLGWVEISADTLMPERSLLLQIRWHDCNGFHVKLMSVSLEKEGFNEDLKAAILEYADSADKIKQPAFRYGKSKNSGL